MPEKAELTNVIIVDDHPLFRDGVATRLRLEADIKVLEEHDDGGDGLKAIRKHKPDVAVLDVNMPTLNGLQVVKQIRSEGIPTRTVVLTAHHDPEQTLHVIRTGAHAFAAKDVDANELVSTIRAVAAGFYVINGERMRNTQVREWVTRQIEELSLSANTLETGEEYYSPLSAREMQILTYVTHGKSNKEIAQELNISQQTVKNHMTSILRKLNVDDRTQAAVTAIKYGWVRIRN